MRVFVVQKQMRFDETLGQLVPRFSTIEKAEKFGELEYLLSPSAHPFDSSTVIGDLHDRLKDFCDDDNLLLIGNPSLIGMATAIASHYNNGLVNLLQWSGRDNEYTKISARIF